MRSLLLPITAILCITLIEVFAIREGFDGLVLSTTIGAIGVIAGRYSKRK